LRWLPGASFVVNGAAQASDSALVTAAVEKKWLNGWSAAATSNLLLLVSKCSNLGKEYKLESVSRLTTKS
jgi:hypothetical protein